MEGHHSDVHEHSDADDLIGMLIHNFGHPHAVYHIVHVHVCENVNREG